MTGVVRWAPIVLTVGALGLFLVAPAVNGPLLVLVWLAIIVAYRAFAMAMPEPRARAAVDVGFIVLAVAAAFWGGWFLLPAGLAFLVADVVRPSTGARA